MYTISYRLENGKVALKITLRLIGGRTVGGAMGGKLVTVLLQVDNCHIKY